MKWIIALVLLTLLASPVAASAAAVPGADAKTHCGVCGMFVQRHPDWLAVLELDSAPAQFFCGPKDLFKFVHFPGRYLPDIPRKTIRAIYLKDYYSLEVIDGKTAYFVIGSDVRGPMGNDLVPFARREDAEGFLQDHDGRRLLPFAEITPALLRELE